MADDPSQVGLLSSCYWVVGGVVFVVVFIGSWLYHLVSYGLILGILFGWVPSFFIAAIAALLWPLLAVLLIWLLSR